MKKFIKDGVGQKHAVWFNFQRRTIEFAGHPSPMFVPRDEHHYSYTHGGTLWQKACDLYWELEASK